ncbi:MAG: MFS transporter [Hyphomicrobiaceae bacterium]
MLQKVTHDQPVRTRPFWLVMLCAGTIVAVAMGLRQVMGLYLKPMTTDLNIGREPFSLAMAIANLVWGLAAIPFGAIADRYGAGRVLALGALSTMAGIYLMYAANSEHDLLVSGILIGIGVGGTGMTALVGAIGRAAPPEKRPQAIAGMGMAAGIGSFLAFPYIHLFIETIGWKGSLLVTIATLAVILPLAIPLAGKPKQMADVQKSQSLTEAFSEALKHPSFWLLTFGFFVCGFHVAFYSVHLPAFVADKGMPGGVAIAALTAVGIANIIGTFLSGQSTKFMPKRFGLSFIYSMRCFAFLGLLYLPMSPATILGISILLGLFWLSTVPLTSSMVATFFGPQWMSMLFGFVFLSHQLGSFTGLWLAGTLYDATKSYDTMWWICIGLALFAALVHLPIREQPVARLLGGAMSRIKIEITPYVIDLGQQVVRLSNITSIGYAAYRPLRPLGAFLVAGGLGVLAADQLRGWLSPQSLGLPSTAVWLAGATAALGLLISLISSRRVVIRTADGGTATVPSLTAARLKLSSARSARPWTRRFSTFANHALPTATAAPATVPVAENFGSPVRNVQVAARHARARCPGCAPDCATTGAVADHRNH